MAAFAGKSKKIFVLTVSTPYPGKSIMENTTVKILVYYFFYMGSQVTVFLAELPIIRSLKLFIIVLYAAVIRSMLGLSSSVLFGAST